VSTSVTKYSKLDSNSRIANGFLTWYEKIPDEIALNINGIDYTYQDVFNKSLSIYSKIKHLENELIGIQCVNNVNTYAAILAISYIGSAYVPLNNKYPAQKIKEIVEDAKLKCIVCFNDDSDFLLEANLIKIDDDFKAGQVELELKDNSQLAYVIYTSGSTGKPKGVPVSRKNINHLFNYYLSEYDFNSKDKFLQSYELSFDVSVFSIFCAWNVGASVYVVPESNAKHIEIFKTIKQHKITVASFVPSVLSLIEKYLPEFSFPNLRYSFFSGDTLKQTLAKKWKACLPNGEIHNFYGPTETTIVCTRYIWRDQEAEQESRNNIVPIGKPFTQMNFLLLSEGGEVISDLNTEAELCFVGEQVIDAYLNNLYEDRFIQINNKRFYKTGDRVSLNEKGNLVFHGRLDSQVKINGYRVELAEIENAINTSCGCQNKVIVKSKNGTNQLIAFIESDNVISLHELLENKIPSYMMPTKFIFVKHLPLTINGKLDIEQLNLLSKTK
jgi:D-alanine--poly(phosphoribitol) ligase subunit 1